MRTTLAGFLLILLPSLASGNATVAVEAAHVEIIPSDGHVEELCGDARAAGCTRFVAYRLETSCLPLEDGARMTVTASFRPWILLRNLGALTHEHEHIADMRAGLERHAARLESVRFGAVADCEQAALRERRELRSVVESFARASSARRDARPSSRMARGD